MHRKISQNIKILIIREYTHLLGNRDASRVCSLFFLRNVKLVMLK
jgi:hypothetical protein